MNKVLVLSGPTATGKTGQAILLAKKFGLEIVNFDSLLFYRELSIGTAKPTKDEQANIPHHLINVCSIAEPMNAADFAKLAAPIIEEIHQRKKNVLLVGGSGFYLQALLEGMWDSPTTPLEVSQRSDELYVKEGITPFLEVLEKNDRESFHRLHANDHYRIRRAVEHFWTHHSPFSLQRNVFSPQKPQHWQVLHLHLDLPKEDHLKIIEARTELMVKSGLVDEVQTLLKNGFIGTEKPLQAIGYKETLDWLNGVYGSDQAAYIERIVINTRRLAKSQRTWFKKKEKFVFDPRHESEALMAKCHNFISQE
ncbi:MAG: tRNA (adenosine(37)-N6)-dimethylallyltransferase MiaA [Bacteriovoracia bacterium]